MWTSLNDGFLSIVQTPGDTEQLTVRARVKGDIEAVFPDAIVIEDLDSDYRFLASVSRTLVARAIVGRRTRHTL